MPDINVCIDNLEEQGLQRIQSSGGRQEMAHWLRAPVTLTENQV